MDVRATDANQSQYLSFFIDGEEYAIGILQVKEIIRYETVTKVPTTPRWIRGVLNLRGLVVPVVDLAAKFGLRETPVTGQTCVVIVETDLDGERTLMGVVADAVSQVLDFRPEDIGEPPPFGTRIRVDYIVGMGKVGKKFVHILDIDGVLSAAELMAVTSATGEPVAEVSGAAPGPAAQEAS
ncbi:MAG TPA: chemotaxis protein CheW [Polyangia bacterium]|nr:chemotaxis protein CheW [Polyangia bacterium]